MITFNKHPKNTKNSLKETLARTGAIAVVAAGGVAAPAAAQSGGTEAPAAPAVTVPNQAGGAEAPAMPEADQALNLQAQDAVTVLSERFAKFQANHPTTKNHLQDAQGNQLVNTTTTVPVKGNRTTGEGQYTFNVISDVASGEVYSLTASEGPIPVKNGESQPPYASVTFDQNPATNTWEAGGIYKLSPPQGAVTAGNENYLPISAGIESVAPGVPRLNAGDISATASQINGLLQSAEHGQAVHQLEPAFNLQGSTVEGPAN